MGVVEYIELVQTAASALVSTTEDYSVRTIGVFVHEFTPTLLPVLRTVAPDASESLVEQVIDDLEALSIVSAIDPGRYALSDDQRRAAADLRSMWPSIFATGLDEDQTEFLRTLVEMSLDPSDLAPREVVMEDLFSRLGWAFHDMKSTSLFYALENRGMISGVVTNGPTFHHMRPTYAGVVRATQQEPTATRQLVESLLPDWETASVEFKLELSLDKDAGKAEFAKDANALATTKTSGEQRYLVIGFDPKTHLFARTLDPRQMSLVRTRASWRRLPSRC